MRKDPFHALADEVTLAREEIQNLRRSSLTRDEAEDLNQIITKAQTDMLDAGEVVEKRIEAAITNATYAIRSKTEQAAKRAAVEAILETRQETLKVAQDLSEAAGEARQQAWRYFGGFWVWLVAMLAIGAFFGSITTMTIQGRADAGAFGQYVSVYCGSAGGTKVTDKTGNEFCAVPMR